MGDGVPVPDMSRRSLLQGGVIAGLLAAAAPDPPPAAAAQPPASPAIASRFARHVDPVIGTDGRSGAPGGATLVGPQRPFGVVALGPDCEDPDTNGYNPAGEVVGVSHTHVSGTGGASKYGNFRLTPMVGPPRLSDLSSPLADEVAEAGYWSGRLTRDDVRVELTATRLAGVSRFTFPASTDARLSLDVTSAVFDRPAILFGPLGRQRPVSSRVRVVSATEVEATATFTGGWNPGEYTLHAVVRFGVPARKVLPWRSDVVRLGQEATGGRGVRLGALASFDTRRDPVVEARVGVSFVSLDQARRTLDREVGARPFADLRADAAREWDAALGRVRADTPDEDLLTIFYTALYHSHVMPHDVTGEVGTDLSAPHYTDFYVLWDTARTVHPLLTLVQRERQEDMVQSLVDVYRASGWLPTGYIAGRNGNTRGGSFGDVLVADALVKGLTGIDYRTALEAQVTNAVEVPPDLDREGRAYPGEYAELGYLPVEAFQPGRFALGKLQASRTVEYSVCDFAIATTAEALGQPEEADRFRVRATHWQNLWDAETRAIRPRSRDGWFVPFFDPYATTLAFYEGSGYQYAMGVSHDVQGVVNRLGGDDAFVAWLDRFFGRGGPYHYNPGNEADLLAPYYYVHGGRPDRASDEVRTVLARDYANARAGLPSASYGNGSGNDDSGAISSVFVWGAMGLYPNAGQPFYYLTAPLLPRTTLEVGGARPFVVEAPGAARTGAQYIVGADLDGRPLERPWITHDELAAGGVLSLRLAPAPGEWGRAQRPPSQSPVGLVASVLPARGAPGATARVVTSVANTCGGPWRDVRVSLSGGEGVVVAAASPPSRPALAPADGAWTLQWDVTLPASAPPGPRRLELRVAFTDGEGVARGGAAVGAVRT